MSSDQSNRKPIDEISGVLHGQQAKTAQLEKEIRGASLTRSHVSSDLDSLLAQVSALCEEMSIEIPEEQITSKRSDIRVVAPTQIDQPRSWGGLVKEYDPFIQKNLPLDDLLDSSVITQINTKFDAPLARTPWDKWDTTVVFGAALVGIIVDWFCAPLGNPLSDKLRSYGTKLHDNGGVVSGFKSLQRSLREGSLAGKFEWLDKLANMDVSHDNLPIDYTGKHFGGAHHRVLSPGHDLLRFMSAIWQIKNGQFIGTRFENGQAIMEVFGVSEKGKVYTGTADWQTAAVLYLLHVVADFFTKTSLPIPGTSLLKEIPNRDIRKFVSDMYEGRVNGVPSEHGGVNLRHLVGQSVTPTVISLIIWLYHLIRYKIGGWWATRQGTPREEEAIKGLKLNEMMATAHTLVTGVNIGRVVITQNPTSLNIAELFVCMKHLFGLAMKTLERRSPKAKFERNQLILAEGWDRVEAYVLQPLAPGEIVWPTQPIIIGREAA